MKTEKLNSKKPDGKILLEIALLLKKGGVVIFPTDTVYGIIASAKNKNSIEKFFKIKNRPLNKPFPVFVKNLEAAKRIAHINKEQEKLLKYFWPGKITAVLKIKKNSLPGKFFDKNTIALRISEYKPLNILFKKIDMPLIQTSANISGEQPLNNPEKIFKIFKKQKEKPDLVIDAGKLTEGKPSTILDLTSLPPKILRN